MVNDEPEYEGNIVQSWGNITAQELVHRFWITVMRGGYAGHGETYSHPEDLIWWAKGGELHGEAWKRIGFLLDVLKEDVKNGLTPMGKPGLFPWTRVSGAADGDVRYIYLGEHQPVIWATGLPRRTATTISTSSIPGTMKITPVEKYHHRSCIRHGTAA